MDDAPEIIWLKTDTVDGVQTLCLDAVYDSYETIVEYTRVNQWVSVGTTPPPKDGTAFLGYFPFKRGYVADQSIVNIHWSGWGGGVWDNTTSGGHMSDSPTHWMPLPTPPGEGE